MEQRIVDVENVSIKFNLSSEKIDSMKDYLVKRLKGQISFDEFWALQLFKRYRPDGDPDQQ